MSEPTDLATRLLAELGWAPEILRLFPGTYRVSCTPEGEEQAAWTSKWMIQAGGDVEKEMMR